MRCKTPNKSTAGFTLLHLIIGVTIASIMTLAAVKTHQIQVKGMINNAKQMDAISARQLQTLFLSKKLDSALEGGIADGSIYIGKTLLGDIGIDWWSASSLPPQMPPIWLLRNSLLGTNTTPMKGETSFTGNFDTLVVLTKDIGTQEMKVSGDIATSSGNFVLKLQPGSMPAYQVGDILAIRSALGLHIVKISAPIDFGTMKITVNPSGSYMPTLIQNGATLNKVKFLLVGTPKSTLKTVYIKGVATTIGDYVIAELVPQTKMFTVIGTIATSTNKGNIKTLSNPASSNWDSTSSWINPATLFFSRHTSLNFLIFERFIPDNLLITDGMHIPDTQLIHDYKNIPL